MRSLRRRTARTPVLIAALALFLMGSNYCTLSALAGDTHMACLSTPGDASAASMPACHRAAATHSDSKPASKSGAKSCCPDPVVAPTVPTIEKADAAFTTLPHAVVAAVVSPSSPAVINRHGPRPAPDAEPLPRFTYAPTPARAPPLA